MFIGCSEKRVLVDELMEKEGVYYFESKPYTGIVYDAHQFELKPYIYDDRARRKAGELIMEGYLKSGIREGLWKLYEEHIEVIENLQTLEDGSTIVELDSFTTGGQLEIEANYKDGKLEGLWKWYYEDGGLKMEGYYKDGELISEKCWDEMGSEEECL